MSHAVVAEMPAVGPTFQRSKTARTGDTECVNDWRLTNQMTFLKGATLSFRKYRPYREGWEHDHCEFCFCEFADRDAPGVLREGYATEDEYYWVCSQCFSDFVTLFGWIVRKI